MTDLIGLIEELHIPNTFNVYTDVCDIHDGDNSPYIRLDNLIRYFRWLDRYRPDTVLVGEAFGWRGGRRSGLPFTDNKRLERFSKLYVGMEKVKQATVTSGIDEQSANSMWGVFEQLETPPAMWNMLPLHPHKIGLPFTNRRPKASDIVASNRYTLKFIKQYEFKRIFAIGKVAQDFLKREGITATYIRHPSYGGKSEFIEGMFKHFGRKLDV